MYNRNAIFKRYPDSKDQNAKPKVKIEMPQNKDAHLLAHKTIYTQKMGKVPTIQTDSNCTNRYERIIDSEPNI